MKLWKLDAEPAAIRNVILPLSLDQAGTAVEVNGNVVAYIVPTSLKNGQQDEPWTDAKNDRRCDLIDKKYNGEPLSMDEEVELLNLQDEVSRHVRRVAPLPIDSARQLHQELLMQVRHSTSS
jgi:hypothetical protein